LGLVAPVIVPAILTLWLISVLVYGKSIIEILAAVLLSRPKGEGGHRNSLLATLIAWVIVFALVSILTRPEVYPVLSGVFQQVAAFLITRIGVAPQEADLTSPPPTSHILLFYYSILVFAAIIVVSFSMIFASFYRAYTYAREKHIDTNSAVRKEILDAVQAARMKLQENGSYHETILECYKRMCRMLSDKGYSITPSETAREFSESVSKKLELGRASVNGLTFLFEEARYSAHTIKEENRQLALGCLSSLEQVLNCIGVEYEAAV